MSVETVAIVGAGAMGAMYAAHLASAGMRVLLVAEGERAERLRRNPVSVNGIRLNTEVHDVSGPGPHPTADLVLVAVKDRQLDAALTCVTPLVGPGTTFVSVLNGLDSEETISARFGAERVLLCIALAMDAQRDGSEVTYRQAGRLVLGPMSAEHPSEPLREVEEALTRAGLAWEAPADMRHEMWWKFMVNVGVNQASAVVRAGYGAFVDDGPARSLMLALCDEVVAVSAAEGVPLGAPDLERWQRVLEAQPADGWTSMRQDVEAGRPTEVESFAGRVVALGERHGIATPFNQAMLWTLRALESRVDP